MDYRALLKKYINHVGLSEGTTFLGNHDRGAFGDSVEFTDAEWTMLQVIEQEGEGDQPLEIELPRQIVKDVNANEVIIHIGGQTQVFYKE